MKNFVKLNGGSLIVCLEHVASIKFERYAVITLAGGGLIEITAAEDVQTLNGLLNENVQR